MMQVTVNGKVMNRFIFNSILITMLVLIQWFCQPVFSSDRLQKFAQYPETNLTISILGTELTYFDKDKLKKILESKLKLFRAGKFATSEYSLIELVELAGYLERYSEAIEIEKNLIEYVKSTIGQNNSSASPLPPSLEQDFPVEVMELDIVRLKVLSGLLEEAKKEYPKTIARLEERKNRKFNFWRSHCNDYGIYPSCKPCEVAIAFAYKGDLDFAEKIFKEVLETPRGLYIVCENPKESLSSPPVKAKFRLYKIGYDDGISECFNYLIFQYAESGQREKAISLIQFVIDKMNSESNLVKSDGVCKLLISKIQNLASTIDTERTDYWLSQSQVSKAEGIKLIKKLQNNQKKK